MDIIDREYRGAFSVLFASFVLFGISVTVIGAVLPRVLADFAWDYLAAGFVIAAGAIGYFVSAYIAGKVVDRIGFRTAMAIGAGLDAIGLAAFAASPSPTLNAVLYFLIGVGQGFIEVAVNWSIVKMSREGSGRAMSLMHGAFSIGAVLGPVATGILVAASIPWAVTYRALGVLFLLLLGATFLVPTRGIEGSPTVESEHHEPLHGDATFWLGFVVLLLYVGVEMGLSNWMGEYFVSALGATAALGAFSVSAFWVGLLIGRLGLPFLFRGPKHDRVLLLLGVVLTAATVILAITGFTGGIAVAFFASVVAGFGCSCVYPISVSLVGEAFPEAQGEAMGFASAGGGLGAFVFPLLTAYVAKAWGIRAGYALFVPMSLAVLGACALLTASARRRIRKKTTALDLAIPAEPR